MTRDLVGVLSKHNAGAVPRDRYQFGVLGKVDSPMEDSDDERTVAPIQVSRQFEDDMAAAVDGVMRRYDQEYLPGGAGEAGAQACVLLWGPRTSKQVLYSCTKGVDPKKLSAGGFADALQFALRTAEEMGEADDQDLDEVQSWMLDFVSEDIKRMLTTVAKEIRSIELHQKQNKCTSGSAAGRDTQKRGGDDDSMDDSDEDDALLHLDSVKSRARSARARTTRSRASLWDRKSSRASAHLRARNPPWRMILTRRGSPLGRGVLWASANQKRLWPPRRAQP